MPSADTSRPARGNHVLSGLSSQAHATLAPMLQRVDLAAGQILHECGQPFAPSVYFPTTSILSAVLPLQTSPPVQVASVGNEGFSGVEMLAGAASPLHAYLCQVEGQAMRMSASDFEQALDQVPGLRVATNACLQVFINQLMQAECCNGVHPLEGRFARWLLMARARTGRDEFCLPRTLLAALLSAQRQNVSLMVGFFQQAGLIHYQHDRLRVLDWQGVREASCACECSQAEDAQAAAVHPLPG